MGRGTPPPTDGGIGLGSPEPVRRDGLSRGKQVGVHLLGLLLLSAGVFGVVQAGAVNDQRSADTAAAMEEYTTANQQRNAAEAEVLQIPRPVEAGRWVTAAEGAAASIATKQTIFVQATSSPTSEYLRPERIPNGPGGKPLEGEELAAVVLEHRKQVVDQTEREMTMLVAGPDRDTDGFNAAGQWYENVRTLSNEIADHEWVATVDAVLDDDKMLPVTWLLVDPARPDDPLAAVTASYNPVTKVFSGFTVISMDQEEGA